MKLVHLTCALAFCVSAFALDREAFTFTNYDLNVRVEPDQLRLGVRGKVALRNDSGSPQRSLVLQISSSLDWRAITFQGTPVEFVSQAYLTDIDHTGAVSEAIVVLPQPVAPKQTVELEIAYEGVVPLDTTRLTRIGVPRDKAGHSDWDQIGRSFAAVRGIGYVAWYPIASDEVGLTHGDSLQQEVARWKQRESAAKFNAEVCVMANPSDPQLTTVMNAARRSAPATSNANCNTYSYEPLGAVVPVFAIGRFFASEHEDIQIYSLFDHQPGANDYASAVEEVAPLVTKWFGDHRDKPDGKALTVDLPDSEAASYESGDTLLMPLTGSDTKLLLSAAQQLSHLLFPSPRVWIRDGLSNYAQARFIEEKEGRQAAIAYLETHRSALLGLEKSKSPPGSLVQAQDEFASQTKAMYVWWMLREMIGENALDATLKAYKADADTDPGYMQKLLEAQAHRDLQWFFDNWVYDDRGLPDFRIASVYSSTLPSGGYMATVTIENIGSAAAEVPVTLHFQGGEASGKVLVRGNSKASVRIQTPEPPQAATVNDGSVPESDLKNNEFTVESATH
jgi:hypothetical protein